MKHHTSCCGQGRVFRKSFQSTSSNWHRRRAWTDLPLRPHLSRPAVATIRVRPSARPGFPCPEPVKIHTLDLVIPLVWAPIYYFSPPVSPGGSSGEDDCLQPHLFPRWHSQTLPTTCLHRQTQRIWQPQHLFGSPRHQLCLRAEV